MFLETAKLKQIKRAIDSYEKGVKSSKLVQAMYLGKFLIEDLFYNKCGYTVQDVARNVREQKLDEDKDFCDMM